MRIHGNIKKIVTIFIALVFFINSSGYLIFLHHCSDTNSNEFSFFVEDFSCDHEKASHCCEHEKSGKSCGNTHKSSIAQKSECCSTNNELVKIQEEFTTKCTSQLIKVTVTDIFAENILEKKENFLIKIPDDFTHIKEPLFGFDRTISLHQLKLDFIA